MCRASAAVPSELPIRGAIEIAIRIFGLLVCSEAHRPSAVSAFHKPCKDLRSRILHHPAAALDLRLHPFKHILADYRFMRMLDPDPFILRFANTLLILVDKGPSNTIIDYG